MYKNIKYLIFSTVFLAILLISISIFTINRLAWEKYITDFNNTTEIQVNNFIDTTYENLNSLIISNAVWTEALEKLNDQDSEWLYENATGYLVDDGLYNIDFIYITTEDNSFTETYGEPFEKEAINTKSFTDTLYKDKVSNEIIWVNQIPILLISSPFFDNNNENPTGCYIIGRKLDETELIKFQNITGHPNSSMVSITKAPVYSSIESDNYKKVAMSFPITLMHSEDYINIELEVPVLNYIFEKQNYNILSIFTVICIISAIILLFNLKKVVNSIILIINNIENISKGNYKKQIKVPNNKLIPELKTLVNSVNTMSMKIDDNISTINNQVSTINHKYNEMIELIGNIVEMNDAYTYKHSISVSKYALIIGKSIGYKDLENLELAAKLHDIGKISIPTHILNKPGKLTVEEYEIVKQHPVKGYRLISKIDFFQGISTGIKYHHERLDGTGYPEGLKGNDIPLSAQIISVADVYDALTSDRSYRKAMKHEDAMKIILNGSGRAFNPVLVNAFYKEMENLQCNLE